MVKIKDLRSITQRTNGTRPISSIKYIARHHSATTTGNFQSFWRHWHNTKGWGTGGYHEIILRDGTVELCYDPQEITNGVGGHNSAIYNICLVGNGSFTEAQEKAFEERTKYWLSRFGLSVNAVKGHNEFSGQSTTCPGINMNIVRKRLANGSVEQVSAPKTATQHTQAKLVVDGYWGNATTKALQAYFKSTIDGVISGQPQNSSTRNIPSAQYGSGGSLLIKAMQRYYKSGTIDGIIGSSQTGKSSLITAMQKKYGLKVVDGTVSYPSNLVMEIQRRLNNGTL